LRIPLLRPDMDFQKDMDGMEEALELLRKALQRATRCKTESAWHELHYPLCPTPRVAVLGLKLRGPHGVHCLPQWSAAELRRLRPQALAGWWNELAEVARLALAGELELPDLQFPVILFSRPDSAPLPARCHDLLWDWFRVPTFEQIRAADGALLAYECEARDGYHLAAPGAETQLALVRATGPCACGSPAPLYRSQPASLTANAG